MNEILKGMDNAAEKINENFEVLGFESGENNNGSYIRFGNGLQICWGSADFERGSSELLIETPAEYIIAPVAVFSANSHAFADIQDMAYLGIGTNSVGTVRIMRHTSLPSWRGTGSLAVNWMTTGMWK